MKFLTTIFFFIFIINSFAQSLEVTGVKNAFIENGKELNRKDKLPRTGFVIIKSEGFIYVVNSIGQGCGIRKEGSYDLDSFYTSYKRRYSGYDSAKAVIDSIFPNGVVTGKFRSVCMTDYYGSFQNLSYKYGNIAFFEDDRNLKVHQDSLFTLRWRDPKYVKGRYFLVFKNMFEEIVDYRISDTNSIILDFNFLADESVFQVTVYSEDGRASSSFVISTYK